MKPIHLITITLTIIEVWATTWHIGEKTIRVTTMLKRILVVILISHCICSNIINRNTSFCWHFLNFLDHLIHDFYLVKIQFLSFLSSFWRQQCFVFLHSLYLLVWCLQCNSLECISKIQSPEWAWCHWHHMVIAHCLHDLVFICQTTLEWLEEIWWESRLICSS